MQFEKQNQNVDSKVGEVGAEVDAELVLQRYSTNTSLQPAPKNSQMPTVAANPNASR